MSSELEENASVCVLILNYISYWDTLRYVKNLRDQKGIQIEILIVDNCSPNESFGELSRVLGNEKWIDVIQSPYNGGYAYGNNFGLRFLQNKNVDYILISNNDIFLDDDMLISEMVEEYEKQVIPAFIAPRMLVNGREDRKHQAWKLPKFKDDVLLSLRSLYILAKWLGLSNRYYFPEWDEKTRAVDCLNGSFFIGKKDIFYKLGLFDEGTFLYVEESILGHRIKESGLTNYLMRSKHFHHDQGKTTRGLYSQIKLQWHWLNSAIYYQIKYNRVSKISTWIFYFLFSIWIFETLLVNVHRLFKR